jgi:hypothetical protein
MLKISSVAAGFLVVTALSGCVSSSAVQTGARPPDDEAAAAAAAALASLDNGGKAALPSSAPAPAAASRRADGPEPAWVASPDAVFDRTVYMAAVGYGPDRGMAEKNALANLTALFGQSIQGEQVAATRYSEAVRNGAVDSWTEDTAVTNAIKTSVELESLIGAEIKDYWYDGNSVHYAAAVMERKKTATLYADMIRSNERIINELTVIPAEEKNTLDAYSRYTLAGTIADANRVFANVLSVVGNAGTGINHADMKKGDDYRLAAADMAKNIPIAVKVVNDKSNRIQSAFATALNTAGFRSSGGNTRYVLNVENVFSPVDLPNQANKFVRYTVDANLTDTTTGNILLPYTITGRAGHLTLPEAENRAVADAAKKIGETYGSTLSDYLSALLPSHR